MIRDQREAGEQIGKPNAIVHNGRDLRPGYLFRSPAANVLLRKRSQTLLGAFPEPTPRGGRNPASINGFAKRSEPDRNASKALIQLCKPEVTGSIPVRSTSHRSAADPVVVARHGQGGAATLRRAGRRYDPSEVGPQYSDGRRLWTKKPLYVARPIDFLAECLRGPRRGAQQRIPLVVGHYRDQHRDGLVAKPGRYVAVVAEPARELRLVLRPPELHVVLDRQPGPASEALASLERDEDVQLLGVDQRAPSVERLGCGTLVEIPVENR